MACHCGDWNDLGPLVAQISTSEAIESTLIQRADRDVMKLGGKKKRHTIPKMYQGHFPAGTFPLVHLPAAESGLDMACSHG